MTQRARLSVVRSSSTTTGRWSQDAHLRQVLKVALETLKSSAAASVAPERKVTIAYLEAVIAQLEAGSPAALRGALLLALSDLEHVESARGVRSSVYAAAFRIFGVSLGHDIRNRKRAVSASIGYPIP